MSEVEPVGLHYCRLSIDATAVTIAGFAGFTVSRIWADSVLKGALAACAIGLPCVAIAVQAANQHQLAGHTWMIFGGVILAAIYVELLDVLRLLRQAFRETSAMTAVSCLQNGAFVIGGFGRLMTFAFRQAIFRRKLLHLSEALYTDVQRFAAEIEAWESVVNNTEEHDRLRHALPQLQERCDELRHHITFARQHNVLAEGTLVVVNTFMNPDNPEGAWGRLRNLAALAEAPDPQAEYDRASGLLGYLVDTRLSSLSGAPYRLADTLGIPFQTHNFTLQVSRFLERRGISDEASLHSWLEQRGAVDANEVLQVLATLRAMNPIGEDHCLHSSWLNTIPVARRAHRQGARHFRLVFDLARCALELSMSLEAAALGFVFGFVSGEGTAIHDRDAFADLSLYDQALTIGWDALLLRFGELVPHCGGFAGGMRIGGTSRRYFSNMVWIPSNS